MEPLMIKLKDEKMKIGTTLADLFDRNNKMIFKLYKDSLGEHFNTRVSGTGNYAFSMKLFERGMVLKRANRGFIVLDKLDILCLKDIIDEYLNKNAICETLAKD